MLAPQLNPFFRRTFAFLGAGLVSNAPTAGAILEGVLGMVILGVLLGGFCGLVFGLVTSNLVRFVGYMIGRHLTGSQWTIISTLLGAAMFTCLLLANDSD